MTSLKTLIAHTRATVDELLHLCTADETGGALYAQVVGPHIRHVLDHFDSLLEGSHCPEAVVNYDARSRDIRTETMRGVAVDRLRRVLSGLQGLEQLALDTPLQVLCSSVPGESVVPVPSTLGRELLFVQSHAIHHQAVIRAQAEALGLLLPPDFGKAPATIAQERLLAAG